MFYTYRQNNARGYFTRPALEVVVEANSPAEADAIALTRGVYFDGVGDCDCCGSRWRRQYDGEEGDFEVPLPMPRICAPDDLPDQLVVRKLALPPAPRRLEIEA